MRWRPIRRSLAPQAVALMDDQRSRGLTPLPVHLFLVGADDERRTRTACDGLALGQWITGDRNQVTCVGCLEWVHA